MSARVANVMCAVLAVAGATAQPLQVSGSFAVTEVVRFDYNRDGHRNRVQFWMEVFGRPAVGTPGDAGYRPEEGFLKYYMLDLDKGVKVLEWDEGIHMGGPPPDRTYPMSGVVITGKTASFEAFNLTWTITDGGEGIAHDTVTINDGFRTRSKVFYGGDLTVGPAPSGP